MNARPDPCLCGASRAIGLFEIASRQSGARSTLMRCEACGSLFPESRPAGEEPARLYDLHAPPRAPWRRWARRLVDRSRADYVERATPRAARRVLDFGCGAGTYLARVAAPGREGFGTDIVTPVADGAWRWLAPDDLERFAPYDWITLGHVIEHLDDPREVLKRLARLLAPGGGIWIATPRAESSLFRAAGAWARDIDFPRHRRIFSRQGLDQLLGEAGLHATYRAAPRINAVLNALTTAAAILEDRGASPARRWAGVSRLTLALVAHLSRSGPRREADSPELVAVCGLTPPDRPPVR